MNNKEKLQESIQKALLGQLNEEKVDSKTLEPKIFSEVTEDKKVENGLKLSEEDIAKLKSWGESDKDIPQIEEALSITKFTVSDVIDGQVDMNAEKEITAQEARDILGDERFLSGLDRSAFHWNSGRYNADETKYVSFDSSALFKESKGVKTEASVQNYNWRDDIQEVENTEENDELVYTFAQNLIDTDPDYEDYNDPWEIASNIIFIWKIDKDSKLYDYLLKWYGSESNMKKNIRSFYETNDAIYFETGTGYSIFDADLLGGNADGRTADEFSKFVDNGGKRDELDEGLNEDLSEVEKRANELRLMDLACRSINDEDYVDIWLQEGCPDESTQEDYEDIARYNDFDRIKDLFKKLMKYAVEDGLFRCPEEAYEYAKKFQPELKNLK